MTFDHIFYIAYFILGLSISELLHAIFNQGYLKRIAESHEKFVKWAEKEDKK